MYLLLKNKLINDNICQLCLKSINGFIGYKALNTMKVIESRDKCLIKSFNSNKLTLNTIETNRWLTTSADSKGIIKKYIPNDLADNILYKIRSLFGLTTIPKWRLKNTSVFLYESATDGIDIEKFFTHLKIPDSYLSWFLVTQLHVWMLMVRAIKEGKEGRVLRNEVVGRMWDDSEERLKHLLYISPKIRRKGLQDLVMQFQAAIFAYDEGLFTDDRTLSAALWRTLFMYETVDPQHIETMVSYVRTQIDHLLTIETEKFFLDGKIVWKHFSPLYP